LRDGKLQKGVVGAIKEREKERERER
jgi:hypothetical protein